jgi:hypothetical protein
MPHQPASGPVYDGDRGDITVTEDGADWQIEASAVGTAEIADGSVALADMANLATSRLLGRVTAGTGAPEALTGTQATTLLDAFTSALKGLAPASGGGTTNYLRADGTWTAPAGSASADAAGLIDVTLSPFSADNTGVDDCISAVKTAAEYARDNGYGGIYFPPGDYKFSRSVAAGTNNYTCLSSIDLDGREVFRQEFGADETPADLPIDLDVAGVRRLTLTIDFAAGGPGGPVRLDDARFEK